MMSLSWVFVAVSGMRDICDVQGAASPPTSVSRTPSARPQSVGSHPSHKIMKLPGIVVRTHGGAPVGAELWLKSLREPVIADPEIEKERSAFDERLLGQHLPQRLLVEAEV